MNDKPRNRKCLGLCARRRLDKFFDGSSNYCFECMFMCHVCKSFLNMDKICSSKSCSTKKTRKQIFHEKKQIFHEKLLSICGSTDQNYYIFGSMLYYDLSTLSNNYVLSNILFSTDECIQIKEWMSRVGVEYEPINFDNEKQKDR